MSFPKYPGYKTTGLEWPTEAPAHWKQKRLKFVVQLNPSRNEVSDRDRSEEVSFLPMEAVGDDGSLSLEQTRPIAAVETGYTYFRDGDVTIAKITPCFENGKGAVMSGLLGGIGFGTTELIVARPRPGEVGADYLHSVFTCASFRGFGEASMYGAGGQKRVSDDFVRNFRVQMPPLAEQTQIQSFLARETAKIDALVAEQERLIDLLEEKREAVISNAVTKGLDPKVPMKDSGVRWLGSAPAHWTVKRLKFLCRMQTGSKDTQDAVNDGAYPFFVRSQQVERINSQAFDCEAVLTAGDGVGVGKVFHHYTGPFDFHQRVYMFNEFQNVQGRFFFEFLRANFFKVALEGGAKSTVDSLRRPMLANFEVCVPPMGEQVEIIQFIEASASEFEKLIHEAQVAIGLLSERRSALISAAVTGQIDVRQHEAA